MTGLRAAVAEVVRLTFRAGPGLAVAYVLVTLIAATTPIALAWLTKLTLDHLVGPGSDRTLTLAVGALAAVGVLVAALPRVDGYLQGELARRVAVRGLDRLFAATDRQVGLARFEDAAFLSRLRLAHQATSTTTSVLDALIGMGRGAITLIGFLGALIVLSPLMTGLVFACAVPAFVTQVVLSRQRAATMWGISPHQRREFFYSQLLANVSAAKEIRLFGLGRFLRGRMVDERRTADAALRRMDRRDMVVQGGLAAVGAAVAGAGLFLVARAARRGELTPGDVMLFVAAVAGVQAALDALVFGFGQSHQQLVLFGHYVDVVRTGPDLPVPDRARPVPPLRRGIVLHDVWFRYDGDRPWVLRGVDLEIPAGRSLALVGLNGTGKSTLVKLLCRLYDPTRGSITWDGVDLRDLDPAQLRERISAVFQDHMNYDLTAAENIAVGDLTALDDPDRLRAAAELAGAHGTIVGLPRGYDTPLTRLYDEEDMGVVLSGGQWQRVALARAVLRDRRDLMILDEPSSGLDPQAEAEVHGCVRRQREGATSLLISHRLNTVRDADVIAVLEDGMISERGDHDTLLANGGGYARLFALQAEGYVKG